MMMLITGYLCPSLEVTSRRVCTVGCPPTDPLSLPELSRSQLSKLFTFNIYTTYTYICSVYM
jgi:hypothetical protein